MNQILSDSKLDYWIDFGTLLGFHREKGIILNDIDIDFGMMESTYQQVVLLKDKLPANIQFFDTSSKHNGPKVYFSYKGVDADIYFYEDLGDSIRSYEKSKYPNEISKIPKSLVFPLTQARHLDKEVQIPANPKGYLKHVYGYIGSDAIRDPDTGYWKKTANLA